MFFSVPFPLVMWLTPMAVFLVRFLSGGDGAAGCCVFGSGFRARRLTWSYLDAHAGLESAWRRLIAASGLVIGPLYGVVSVVVRNDGPCT